MDSKSEPSFGFGRFSLAGCRPFDGLVIDGSVTSLSALERFGWKENATRDAMCSKGADWRGWHRMVRAVAAALAQAHGDRRVLSDKWLPVSALAVHAPISPRQIFCTIANYRSGMLPAMMDKEGGGEADAAALKARAGQACDERRESPPYTATKLPASIIGPFDALPLPGHVRQPDWEVELGVVIGKAARHVSRDQAMDYVAGYTVVNDVTVRELVSRDLPQGMGTDWLAAKSAPGFLPVGPWLVPAGCVPDPYALRMMLRVNGVLMQSERAGDMIFDIAEQIEYLSRHTRLLPGDLICTGSPAGFGLHHGRFLQPGDVIEAGIEGLGWQNNVCRREAA